MTQKEFMKFNIPIIKKSNTKSITYKICNGVFIEFKRNPEKDKFSLYLNNYEIAKDENYSDNAIKNSFLFVKNNGYAFKNVKAGTIKKRPVYVIDKNIDLQIDTLGTLKIQWESVRISRMVFS